jgi:polysaccharide chain length determinant protein (PEP-CTERM system associated)
MQEVLEQLIDYLKGIWIKRRYIMIATWLICPIGWYFVSSMPDVYESKARVYVDTQSLLRPLLRGLTVETNPETQVNLMVKTLLSRPNLERITRMSDLDIHADNSEQFEGIISSLRSNLKISTAGRENIYTLSIQNKNPEMAKNIVQNALTVFIENTLGETRSDSDSAQKFLTTQINEYEKRLSSSESRLSEFKQKYSDVLPNQNGGYYSKLNSAKERLKALELEMLEAKTRLKSARDQISQDSTTAINPENKIKSNNAIQTTFDARIVELESSLDSLQLRYTEQHPDVKALKRQLAHINKQRSDEIQKYVDSARIGENGNLSTLNQSPVLQDVQMQVNQLSSEIASLEVRANNYRAEVTALESKIHTLPEIEAELTALNRDYGITKQKYDELLDRRETAQMGQQADETTDKIQFKVIDPPRAATEPAGPQRILFYFGVLIVGIGIGGGLSFLTSQINPVVTSASQVSRATGFPVFGVIAATDNLDMKRWHRSKTIIFISSNLLLVIILGCFIAYSLFPEAIRDPISRIF